MWKASIIILWLTWFCAPVVGGSRIHSDFIKTSNIHF